MKFIKKIATAGIAAALYSTTSLLYCMAENQNIRKHLATDLEDIPRYLVMAPVSVAQRILGKESDYKYIMDQEGGEDCFFEKHWDKIERENMFGGPEPERFFLYKDPKTGKTERYFMKVDGETVAKFKDCKAIPLTENSARMYAADRLNPKMIYEPSQESIKGSLSDRVNEIDGTVVSHDVHDDFKDISLEDLIERKGFISRLLANERRFNGQSVPKLEQTLEIMNDEINSRSKAGHERANREVRELSEFSEPEPLSVYKKMNGQIQSLYQGENKIYDRNKDNWEPTIIKDANGMVKKVYKGSQLIYEDK